MVSQSNGCLGGRLESVVMDMDALKTDLDLAFRQLPPEVLSQLSRLVLAHKDVFAQRLPAVIESLMPHIKAGFMEQAMGILDVKQIEDAVMDVLRAPGVEPAARPQET